MLASSRLIAALLSLAQLFVMPLKAETREEWIKLGERVHGGFGSFIPVGIRIGLDALQRLDAKPRELTVTFYTGARSPCPCFADGIMIATSASPGQGTLGVAREKAPPGVLALVIIKHRKSGSTLKYTVSESWLPKLGAWNRTLDPAGRYDEVMKAEGLLKWCHDPSAPIIVHARPGRRTVCCAQTIVGPPAKAGEYPATAGQVRALRHSAMANT